MHGETAKLGGVKAEYVSILENGDVWEYDPHEKKAIKHPKAILTGRKWYFYENSGPLDAPEIKERRAAARGGVVVVECLTTGQLNELKEEPHVTLKGFFCSQVRQSEIIRQIILMTSEAFLNWNPQNSETLTREQFVAIAARRVVKRALNSKPLVIVNFLSV